MTDTTRKDMLGCYGNRNMITPNLDSLAEEGIRYENAYTCQPVCGPARSAIFTGMFPHSNGTVANGVPFGDNVKTVGQRLTDHGIQCGYIGKWHLDGGDYFGLGKCPEGWNADYWRSVIWRNCRRRTGFVPGGPGSVSAPGFQRNLHMRTVVQTGLSAF